MAQHIDYFTARADIHRIMAALDRLLAADPPDPQSVADARRIINATANSTSPMAEPAHENMSA